MPLLVRRSVFWEVLVAALVSGALVYLGFAWLSNDSTTWSTAMRFFYFALFGLIVLLVLKWRRTDLKIVLLVPVVVILGLLPYAYMPFASSTNPPMNWGYTSTPEGFFYSINRTQYAGVCPISSCELWAKGWAPPRRSQRKRRIPSGFPPCNSAGNSPIFIGAS